MSDETWEERQQREIAEYERVRLAKFESYINTALEKAKVLLDRELLECIYALLAANTLMSNAERLAAVPGWDNEKIDPRTPDA